MRDKTSLFSFAMVQQELGENLEEGTEAEQEGSEVEVSTAELEQHFAGVSLGVAQAEHTNSVSNISTKSHEERQTVSNQALELVQLQKNIAKDVAELTGSAKDFSIGKASTSTRSPEQLSSIGTLQKLENGEDDKILEPITVATNYLEQEILLKPTHVNTTPRDKTRPVVRTSNNLNNNRVMNCVGIAQEAPDSLSSHSPTPPNETANVVDVSDTTDLIHVSSMISSNSMPCIMLSGGEAYEVESRDSAQASNLNGKRLHFICIIDNNNMHQFFQ